MSHFAVAFHLHNCISPSTVAALCVIMADKIDILIIQARETSAAWPLFMKHPVFQLIK
jgi:hypothetical protein